MFQFKVLEGRELSVVELESPDVAVEREWFEVFIQDDDVHAMRGPWSKLRWSCERDEDAVELRTR